LAILCFKHALVKVLEEFSASLVKESVGRTYAADSVEEAEWDGFILIIWCGLGGCGLCMEICLDVVVNEMNLDN